MLEYRCLNCGIIIKKKVVIYGTHKCKRCSHRKHDISHYEKFCLDCGKKLNKNAIYLNNLRCTSCAAKHKIKTGIITMSGRSHPRYKDGTGRLPYGIDFTTKLKDSIRNRDNYTCQYCEMIEKKHLQIYNRKLEIHHIDHDRNNNASNNLITTCKKCNLAR